MANGSENTQSLDLIETLSVLALVRTAYSSERALMSWIRTSISLYTFGFSISKFIDYLELQEQGSQFSLGMHRLGLLLITMGIGAVVLGMVGHRKRVRRMEQLGLPTSSRFSVSIGACSALLVIGITALIAIVAT